MAASVGLGAAVLPSASSAQTGNFFRVILEKFTSREAGREHSDQLEQVRKALDGKTSVSGDGLSKLVDRLVAMKLISEKDSALLKKLIADIVGATSIDALSDRITTAFKALSDQVGEVAQAIIRIANDSIQYARRVLGGVDFKVLTYVVSADIMGALTGAGTGGQLAGPPGAVVGAVVGAVSGSALVVFDPKR